MRIKSGFRDYYDYVEFSYSPEGGDCSNVYIRGAIKPGPQAERNDYGIVVTADEEIVDFPQPMPWSSRNGSGGYLGWEQFPWRFRWCSICGMLYLLVADLPEPRSWNPQNPEDTLNLEYRVIYEGHPAMERMTSDRYRWRRTQVDISSLVGIESQCARNVSKTLGEPCFIIEHFSEKSRTYIPSKGNRIASKSVVVVREQVPNLGKLGFGTIVSAEQMYQNISMFMGFLKDSPDNVPPISVSDKERLTQKGFDAKVSFRGKAK